MYMYVCMSVCAHKVSGVNCVSGQIQERERGKSEVGTKKGRNMATLNKREKVEEQQEKRRFRASLSSEGTNTRQPVPRRPTQSHIVPDLLPCTLCSPSPHPPLLFMMTSADPVERSWDLSLYELHRLPQEAITDDTEIAVSARSLQSELTCPICLDMLTQTMTTKECLHRFCSECIVTALRSGNKECPTCRKKLVSKRSLRPDPNFDKIVEVVFPNRDEYEAHQESILESLSRSHSQNFITSITDGIKAQMAHVKALNKKNKNTSEDHPDSPHHTPITGGGNRGQGDSDDDVAPPPPKKKKKAKPTPLSSSTAHDSDSGQGGSSSSAEVEIVFKLHPKMMSGENKEMVEAIKGSSTRYIKTIAKALVEHLCKYLAMRISLDLAAPSAKKDPSGASSSSSSPNSASSSVKDLAIFIAPTPGQMVELSGSMPLSQVNDKYWKVNKPMEMFYSFHRS